jgi:hypothetical protein
MFDNNEIDIELARKLSDALVLRSAYAERGILATRDDGQAGFALIGPDCIMYAEIFLPELPPFDFCLN